MTRKKILWLCSWYPSGTDPFNGDFIQRYARAVSLYHDVHVIFVTAGEQDNRKAIREELFRSPGLTEHIIYFHKNTSATGRLRAHWQWNRLFRKAINTYLQNQGMPDLVHVQVPMRAGLLALWLKKKYGIPFVITEHWGIYNPVEKLNYQTRSFFFKKITRKIFREAAAFHTVSSFLGEGVRKWVVDRDYEVIPNVTDTSLFTYRPGKRTRFRFLHVSNMVPLKNVPGILRAFAGLLRTCPDCELVLLGNTDDTMPERAKELGLSAGNCRFGGLVTYEEVAGTMQEADALVIFSDIENSPCVIGEALCCGLPVIATRTGGIPELIRAENGLLVEPGNETELQEAMRNMMDKAFSFNREQIAREAISAFSYPSAGRKLASWYLRYCR